MNSKFHHIYANTKNYFYDSIVTFDQWIRLPIDPRPLGLFRLWFGIIACVNLALLWPDMHMWFGNDGVFPPHVQQQVLTGIRFNTYLFLPYDDFNIQIIKFLGVLGATGLVLGIFPRFAAFCMWISISSFSFRNNYILHSGDNLLRIGSFFLIFAQSGKSFSIPVYSRKYIKQNKTAIDSWSLIPAWPQRILQLQLCIVYLVTGIWKAKGIPWQNGTAVGTVLQLGEFQRFPLPDFVLTPFMSMVMTYSTLLLELGFPILVWFPKTRIPILLAGVALHAGLDWTMNVQLFQWTITSFYILFLHFDKSAEITPSKIMSEV